MKLINKKNMELLEILSRESGMTSQAYLYEENGHWYAYEHSAFMMGELLKGFVAIEQFVHHVYDLLLHRVEVDLELLLNYRIISCSDTELVIKPIANLR